MLGICLIYLCQMHIDHNSPIQAGLGMLTDRLLEGHSHTDRSIDQFAFSLCEKQDNSVRKMKEKLKVCF